MQIHLLNMAFPRSVALLLLLTTCSWAESSKPVRESAPTTPNSVRVVPASSVPQNFTIRSGNDSTLSTEQQEKESADSFANAIIFWSWSVLGLDDANDTMEETVAQGEHAVNLTSGNETADELRFLHELEQLFDRELRAFEGASSHFFNSTSVAFTDMVVSCLGLCCAPRLTC